MFTTPAWAQPRSDNQPCRRFHNQGLIVRQLIRLVDIDAFHQFVRLCAHWTGQLLNLTRMAASATLGNNGADMRGYRNYRGVKVVGAWAWLHDYGMGVATEESADEAFQTLYVLRRVFSVLFILLVASGW